MKKLICILIALLALLWALALPTMASEADSYDSGYEILPLRAGGGGSAGGSGGSGGGGGGGSSGGSGVSGTRPGRIYGSPFSFLPFLVFLFIGAFGGALLYRFRLSKYARNTKRLLLMLEKKDSAWKYKNLQKQIKEIYFKVQKSWSNGSMRPAMAFMSEELYNNHQHQLDLMAKEKKRNVLKRIRLIEAKPVAVHDSEDDALDHVWFYVKGRMVDYIVDTDTGVRIKGSNRAKVFEEYWQLRRTGKKLWVLHKILQKDQGDMIAFTE